MAVFGELFLVIQQPLQLLGEMAHLAVVVVRQSFQELLLILLNVLVDGFHAPDRSGTQQRGS